MAFSRKYYETKFFIFQSFAWFLETVAPDMLTKFPKLPPNVHLGSLVNKASGSCLDTNGRDAPSKIGATPCYGKGETDSHQIHLIRIEMQRKQSADETKCKGAAWNRREVKNKISFFVQDVRFYINIWHVSLKESILGVLNGQKCVHSNCCNFLNIPPFSKVRAILER